MSVALTPRDAAPSGGHAVAAKGSLATLAAVLGVAIAYYLGSVIGFGFGTSAVTSIFWLPNSTMFAVFMLVPPRRWFLYALAVLPVHLLVQVQHHVPLPAIAPLFVTNLADGALGAYLIKRFARGHTRRFDGFRNVLVFVLAAIAAPLVVSFFDAAVLWASQLNHDYWLVWHTRFRSNSLTNMLLCPAIVIVVSRARAWRQELTPRRLREAGLLMLSLLLAVSLVFGGRLSTDFSATTALLYAPLPILLWAALRFGTAGVSLALLSIGTLVIWHAAHDRGPFAGNPAGDNVIFLQVFLTMLAIPSLLLAGLLQERQRAALDVREREAQYRSIVEATGDGVLITTLSQVVVAANPALRRLTGKSEQTLLTTHPRQYLHLDDLQPFDTFLIRASTSDDIIGQALCVREDGGLSRCEIRGRRFSYGGLPHVLLVVRDVTERERAFQELEQRVAERTRALSTVLEISKTVASMLELGPLLRVVLEQLRTLVDYTGATVLMRREDDDDVVILDHQGPLRREQVAAVRLTPEDVERCPTLTRGSPVVVDDIQSESPSARAYRESMPPAVLTLFAYARSVIHLPMRARDRIIGVLRIDSDRPNQYSAHDAELAWALANQTAVAIENARLYDRAKEVAAYEERQRLARELHDSVTQTLCAVGMLGRSLPKIWDRDATEGRVALASLDEMTQSALAEMRTLLLELRPDTLVEAELPELLQQLTAGLRSRAAAPIELQIEGDLRLPAEVHVTLYRVAQEALANASRHAGATRLRVLLQCSAIGVMLRVADDGVGFDPGHVLPGHLGLIIMSERTKAIGASLEIDSAPGSGTVVTVRWPAGAADAAAAGATRAGSSAARRPQIEH
jgi:PAS domain S-box-containing protein